MTLNLRRIVTGHDGNGKSIIAIDEITTNLMSRRPGHSSAVVWTAPNVPADNATAQDEALNDAEVCLKEGTIFRVIEYAPGVAGRIHRTQTVDFATVVSGEIVMIMDDGKEVLCRAGDVIVQRGTVHDWDNRSGKPCIVAFVLIAAKPVATGGHTLAATG